MPRTPFIGRLGIVLRTRRRDRLRFAPTSPMTALAHDGVIASVMDLPPVRRRWSNHDFDGGTRATVAMSIQYTGAARRCDLLCHARTADAAESPLPDHRNRSRQEHRRSRCARPTGSSGASAPNVHSGRKIAGGALAMVTRSAQSPWRKAIRRPTVSQWDLEAVGSKAIRHALITVTSSMRTTLSQ